MGVRPSTDGDGRIHHPDRRHEEVWHMRRIALTVLLAVALALTGGEVATASTHGTGNGQFPQIISLPNGFQPEGISAGRGTSFYVGSLVDGAIYRGDVRTGAGSVLILSLIHISEPTR